MPRTVLFVAAETREVAGFVHRIGGRKLDWPVEFSWIVDGRCVIVADGPGRRLAAGAVDVAFRLGEKPDAIVSIGACGALAPDLRVGDILVADRIIDADGVEYSAFPLQSARAYANGVIASVDHVAVTVSDKRSLRNRGAAGVEMEAAGVAAIASQRSIPFYCVRAVSDTAGQDLVLDFNRFRDKEGRFSRSRIAAAALARPWSRIPGLLRLDRDTRKAAESLGEFLADCRF